MNIVEQLQAQPSAGQSLVMPPSVSIGPSQDFPPPPTELMTNGDTSGGSRMSELQQNDYENLPAEIMGLDVHELTNFINPNTL